jgi:hypothetical protein
MKLSRERRAYSRLNSKRVERGLGQNRTTDPRIFSPHTVPRLCVTIGHQVNEFNSFQALRTLSIFRLEHVVANSSGKVVAKSAFWQAAGDSHSGPAD